MYTERTRAALVRLRRAGVRGDGDVRRAGLGALPHRALRRGDDGHGDDGEEGGDLAPVVPDIHQAHDGAARHGALADNHGDRAEAPAGEQGQWPGRRTQAGEDGHGAAWRGEAAGRRSRGGEITLSMIHD